MGCGELTQVLILWQDARPVFYPQEISLERGWEDRMSRYHVTECQTERNSQLMLLPLLPVVQPAAVGHKRTLQWNNTGLILSTWEGSLAEQTAFTSWWYRWEQSRVATGGRHMLTQLLVKGVNSRPFFVIQGHRELLIFIQLPVGLKTKVTSHWFPLWHRCEAAQVSPGSTVLKKLKGW